MKLETSRESFNIERGVRHGDPLLPKLFTAVLENSLKKKLGINVNWYNWVQKLIGYKLGTDKR